MAVFRDRPVREKLLIVMTVTTLSAIVSAFIAFVVYDHFTSPDSIDMQATMTRYLLAIFMLCTFCGATSLLLADRLQNMISNPLHRLSTTATRVAEDHDYSLRVN